MTSSTAGRPRRPFDIPYVRALEARHGRARRIVTTSDTSSDDASSGRVRTFVELDGKVVRYTGVIPLAPDDDLWVAGCEGRDGVLEAYAFYLPRLGVTDYRANLPFIVFGLIVAVPTVPLFLLCLVLSLTPSGLDAGAPFGVFFIGIFAFIGLGLIQTARVRRAAAHLLGRATPELSNDRSSQARSALVMGDGR